MSAEHTAAAPRRTGFQAKPDGLIASVLLAFLATAGLFYVNIMPALVAGLQDGLGFTARDAGLVASANVYGAAVGALAAVFFVARGSWRAMAVVALSLMIGADAASMLIADAPSLVAVRFVHGLIGGFLVGIAFGVIARTAAPDRTFGMLLVVQFGLGGVGLMFLPGLVPLYGHQVLFLALSAFSVATLLMLPFLADYPPRSARAAEPGEGRVAWAPLAFALLAVFLFQAANMGVAAYVIGLGRSYGLSTDYVSRTLGVANWIGAAGSVLVVMMGVRFGRLVPLLGALALTVAGTAAFHLSGLPWVFVAANVATAVLWAFAIPYLLGLCAAFDTAGRTAALAGFFSKMGLASGPALGAILLAETHYERLINLSVLGLLLCGVLAVWPAVRLDRLAKT